MADCCSNGSCKGHIPVEEIIRDCDILFNQEKSAEIGELLRFWRRKAAGLNDKKGELAMLSELIGHYRMGRDEFRGTAAVTDALDLIRQLDIADSLSAGTIFLNAATALQSFGESIEAAELYKQTEKCYAAHLPPGDERFAGLYNNMASAAMDNSSWQEAEECYLRALRLLADSGNLMDTAVTFVNLARLYDALDPEDPRVGENMDSAMACFDTAEVNGYYAHTCRKCAAAFGSLGRFADEAELNRRADKFYGKI